MQIFLPWQCAKPSMQPKSKQTFTP